MSMLRKVIANISDSLGNALGSINGALKVAMSDGAGNALGSFKGALTVHLSHGHNYPVNLFFDHHTGVTTTLATAGAVGDQVLNFTSAAAFAVGDYIHIDDVGIERTHPKILAIATNAVTIDRPLDFAHPAGTIIEQTSINMNVAGSLASPISYRIYPPVGEVWLISRFIITMVHGSAGDLTKFGGITALTNGVLLRVIVGGKTFVYTIWRTNEDIKSDVYDLSFDDRAGGSGSYSTSAKGSLLDLDRVQARLDGSLGDYMEIEIRDSLVGLSSFRVKAQGLLEGV